MRSRACPWYAEGLCPDSELLPDINPGAAAKLFVVLPYCAEPLHDRLVNELIIPYSCPQTVSASRSIRCKLGASPSNTLLMHCGSTRLRNSIMHSGAGAVFAIGRGAAEIQYPVPAFYARDPVIERGTNLGEFVLELRKAVSESMSGPEIVMDPSMQSVVTELEDADAIAMHVCAGGDFCWAVHPDRVFQQQAGPAEILSIAQAAGELISWDLPALFSICPALLQVHCVDLCSYIRIAPQQLVMPLQTWHTWLQDLRQTLQIVEPDSLPLLDVLSEEPQPETVEAVLSAIELRSEILEIVGPAPSIGDAGAAKITVSALRCRDLLAKRKENR